MFDEPCASLDPISTRKIEELILELKKDYAIAIVTHNMQQAARASDYTGFFWLGELVEFNATESLFSAPKMALTEAYITGRRGYSIGRSKPGFCQFIFSAAAVPENSGFYIPSL